jgi:hypothetical protein
MDGFSISKIILGLQNPEYLKKIKENTVQQESFAPQLNSSLSNSKPQNTLAQSLQKTPVVSEMLQMNTMQNIDRSVFIKNILGLPQEFSQILKLTQNVNSPLQTGTLNIGNLNQELLSNQKMISELFDEIGTVQNIQSQIVAQNQQAQQTDAVALFFSGMISLPDVSSLILQNSKQAVASLIIAMASATKQGMSGDQIQQTLSELNLCIAMAESNNPADNLKSLMTLYLPWLPLSSGVGFNLEITPTGGENESNDSKLSVVIQTKNFGTIKGIFTLTTTNSVDIFIVCNENFPKTILQKNLMQESTTHTMNTTIDIEEVTPIKNNQELNQETKVNLSATNEMNPYLLLMAHSFIRNTILIDNNASLNLAS